jgi:hypothetical protein
MTAVATTSATGIASGGGSTGTPDYTKNGDEGGIGFVNVGVAVAYNNSGSSSFGGQISNRSGVDGADAITPGAGGGGATGNANLAGGDGADGVVIIEQFF